jgi:hypothetical protein
VKFLEIRSRYSIFTGVRVQAALPDFSKKSSSCYYISPKSKPNALLRTRSEVTISIQRPVSKNRFLFLDTGISVFAVHPGGIATDLSSHIEEMVPAFINQTFGIFFKIFFLKTPENGAQTTLHCALQTGIEPLSGLYFA